MSKLDALLSAARDASRNGLFGISQALYHAATRHETKRVRSITRELTSAWRVARVMEGLALEAQGHCYADDYIMMGHAVDNAALELRAWLTRSHTGAPYRVLASVAA